MKDPAELFREYTHPYLIYGEKIRLKIDHTLRVRDLCEDIARSLGLSGDELALASLCGLLHDIGRFEQWRRYGTFDDAKSADHGDLGAEVLSENGLIGTFTGTDRDTVLSAVRYHNKFALPDTLDKQTRIYAGIVRDADKIDILRLFAEGEMTHSTKGTAFSGPVFQTLMNGKPIRSADAVTPADGFAKYPAFIFGFNFRRSFEIVSEEHYSEQMIARQSEEAANPLLKRQLNELNVFLKDALDEKLKNDSPAGSIP